MRARAVASGRSALSQHRWVPLAAFGSALVLLTQAVPAIPVSASVGMASAPSARIHEVAQPATQVVVGPEFVGGSKRRSAPIATPHLSPSPPFNQCPAIGADTSCGVLIEVTDGATNVFDDSSQGPFDGFDDTLIGIVNDSSGTLGGLGLSANSGIFGFDGDGIGGANYAGPGTTLSAATSTSGIVGFTGGLAPGASRYFSLEQALTATQVTGSAGPIGGPVSAAEGQVTNFAQRCACGVSGSHTTTPVTTPWGNFTHTFTDLSIPGRGPALQFGRTYSAYPNATVPAGPLGFGWSNPYGMTIALLGTSPNRVATVTQEDGAQVTFNESGANVWVPAAPRTIATLVFNSGAGTYTFTRQATQVLTFDAASGHLNSMADLNGNTLSLSYNGSGQLSTVTDAASRTLSFAYYSSGNGAGDIQSVTDGIGRSVTFTYDGSGNLATATEPNGGTWSFSYDANHRMLTMLDPNQFGSPSPSPVTNHYDSQGRVDWQTDQLSRKTTFDYSNLVDDPTGLVGTLVITDPKLNAIQEQYSHGEKVAVTAGFGTSSAATTKYAYDPATLLPTSVIDPNLNTTLYSYDAQGNQTSMIDPLGRMTTSTYNNLNEPVTVTDPIGNAAGGTPSDHTTTYTYGANGNPRFEFRNCVMPGGSNCGVRDTVFNHDDSSHPGDVTSIIDPDGQPRVYTYDSAGDRTSITDPLTNKTVSCFDAVGRMTATIAPIGVAAGVTCATTPPAAHTTYFTFDAANELLTSKDPLGHVTTFGYDANRNRTSVTDPKGNVTTHVFDIANEPTKTLRADSPQTTLTTDYNSDGTVADQKDGKNNAIQTYGYDSLGRVTSVKDADNNTTNYTLDGVGNLLTQQDPGGTCPGTGCITSTNDADNELTSVSYSDGVTPNVSAITYDADGQRTAMTMTDGTLPSSWSYDSLHRITSTTDGAGNTVGYGYDDNGNQTSITYPGGHTVTYGLDDASRVHTVGDWLSHTTTIGYDANSNLTTETIPSTTNVVDSYGYNAADQLTSISDVANSTTLFSATYNRDNNGQLSSDSSVPSSTGAYKYSPLNQLCYGGSANTTTCSSPPSGATAYGFDAADNLTTNNGTTQQYDAADHLCWTLPGASANACGPTAPTGATAYNYNTVGERTAMTPPADPTVTYGYDQAHRLTTVSGAGYRTAVLASSPLGYWRLGETSGTTAADSSGNAHTGTYTSSPTLNVTGALAGDANKAVTFNGTTSYVNAGAVTAGKSSSFSAEAWIKTTTTTPHYFLGEGSTTSDTPFDGLSISSSGDPVFKVSGGIGSVTATGTIAVNNNAWHHIVGVRTFDSGTNASNLYLFIDGKINAVASGTTGTLALNTTTIGALRRTSVSLFFAGSVDEAAYYPSALTAVQINNHYRAGQSNYAGTTTANAPVGYWRLGETSGTSAADSSSNTFYTGTYTGGFTLGVTGALTSDTNKAVTLNGTTGYVNVVDTSAGESSTFSAEAWIKTTTTAAPYILTEGSTTSANPFDGLRLDSTGHAQMAIRDNTAASIVATGTSVVNNNAWHYLVGVRNGSTVSIYVDGKLDGTTTGTLGTITLNATAIGALKRTSLIGFFAGTVDEAAYYPSALDTATIARHFHNGTNTNPTVASYTYNGDGLRTSKTVDGITTNYTWDTAQDLIDDGTNQYVYGPNGPLEQINGTTATYYHQDQQGTTRALTDQTGAVAATYTYDPYGNATATSGTAQTPLRFDGEYRDTETGFTYLRNRYYDPTTTQFLTQDLAIAATMSPYAYVAGNPLKNADPTGLCTEDTCIAEAIIAAGSAAESGNLSISQIVDNPELLTGLNPTDLLNALGGVPSGFSVGSGNSSSAGLGPGWKIGTNEDGGIFIRWSPGSARPDHPSNPYWRVSSGRGGKSDRIEGRSWGEEPPPEGSNPSEPPNGCLDSYRSTGGAMQMGCGGDPIGDLFGGDDPEPLLEAAYCPGILQ